MEDSKELVSVIVPVYKVEKYLDRCIKSIREQTYTELEIILVDDGSPDSCGRMCDEYAASDDRIKVIHKQNGGLSDARNAGINKMKLVLTESGSEINDSTNPMPNPIVHSIQ